MFFPASLWPQISPMFRKLFQTRFKNHKRVVVKFDGSQRAVGNIHGHTGKAVRMMSWLFHSLLLIRICSQFCLLFQHASGVAALYLERDASMTPAEVKTAMLSDGVSGVISDAGSYSPNILLSTKELIDTDFETLDPTANPTDSPTPAPTSQPTSAPIELEPLEPTASPQTTQSPTSSSSPTSSPTGCKNFLQGCQDAACCFGNCWFSGADFARCFL